MPPYAQILARWFAVALLCGVAAACDAGGEGGSTPQTLVSACKAGCSARHDGCATTDLALCDFGCAALANLRADCRTSRIAVADCEAQTAWQCLATSEFVAVPVDPSACAAELAAFDEACPFGK
ncbi:MAG: hypothetical protein R3F39_05935 [Myxococcota bacterium]